jgi:hypothetical protein
MKKFITASVLSFMLLGVGSANSDGMRIGVGTAYADNDAHTWIFPEDTDLEPTPMRDCLEAKKKGFLIHDGFVDEETFIFDEKIYKLEIVPNTSYPERIICSSSSPTKVIK